MRERADRHASEPGLSEQSIRLSLAQTRLFTLQFSVLLSSGVPIVSSLDAMAVADVPGLSHSADYLARKLERGWTLSAAMSSLPDAFDQTTVGLIKLGEQTGGLAASLREATRRTERLLLARNKLQQALTYPAAVLVVASGMLAFLCYYMLPRFLPIFASFDVELPWPTRLLVALTSLRAPALVACFGVLAGAGLVARSSHPTAALLRTRLLFDLPLLGRYNRTTACADLCSDLGLMLRAGMSLTGALRLVARSVSDPRLSEALDRTRSRVLQGEVFVEALGHQRAVPTFLVGTLAAGVETGRLSALLGSLARLLVEESDLLRERLTLLLEPLMIAFMGLVVGFVLLACFLPLYRLITVEL